MSKGYNGYKNWTQWNVSLWLNNDEGLYRTMQYWLRNCKTKQAAAQGMLQELEDMGITQTPDGAKYSKTSILAAMCD